MNWFVRVLVFLAILAIAYLVWIWMPSLTVSIVTVALLAGIAVATVLYISFMNRQDRPLVHSHTKVSYRRAKT